MRSFFVIILLVFPFLGYSQGLVKGKTESPTKYLYEISSQDALKLYESTIKFEKFVKTLNEPTDTFNTSTKELKKQLQPGHYLVVYMKKLNFYYQVFQVSPLALMVEENKQDFILHVQSNNKTSVPNAQVYIQSKIVSYDASMDAYVKKRWNKNGSLSIRYLETEYFYKITQKGNRKSKISRSIEQLSYNTFHQKGRKKKVNRGYMTFGKPKYRLGDSIRIKAYLAKKGKPLKKPLKMSISYRKDYKTKYILSDVPISPTTAGNYQYAFQLGDSLDIDRLYTVEFHDKKKNIKVSRRFMLEDYELNEFKYHLVGHNSYSDEDSVSVEIHAFDSNGMPLTEGTAKLFFYLNQYSISEGEQLHVPFKLWQDEILLDDNGITTITLPDSIFVGKNMRGEFVAIISSSNNEVHYKTVYLSKSPKPVKEDAIQVVLEENTFIVSSNQKIKKCHLIKGYSSGTRDTIAIELPHKEVIDPKVTSYRAKNGGEVDNIYIGESKIKASAHRTNDNITILIQNPRHLRLEYSISKLKNLLEKRVTTEDSISIQYKGKRVVDYSLLLNYIWAGKTNLKTFQFHEDDKRLTITSDLPKKVTPGEELEINVQVKDIYNQPVSDVDILASAINHQFKQTNAPRIPGYDYHSFNGSQLNNGFNYNVKEGDGNELLEKEFIYKYQLDTIPFYRYFTWEVPYMAQTDKVEIDNAQFAPFIYRKRKREIVKYILVDEVPVFWSISGSKANTYSFVADEGKHTLKIRTTKKLITIKDVELTKGAKLSLLLNLDETQPNNVQQEKHKKKFSEEELKLFGEYYLRVDQYYSRTIKYVKQGGQLIQGTYGYYGPLQKDKEVIIGYGKKEAVILFKGHQKVYLNKEKKLMLSKNSPSISLYKWSSRPSLFRGLQDVLYPVKIVEQKYTYRPNYQGLRQKVDTLYGAFDFKNSTGQQVFQYTLTSGKHRYVHYFDKTYFYGLLPGKYKLVASTLTGEVMLFDTVEIIGGELTVRDFKSFTWSTEKDVSYTTYNDYSLNQAKKYVDNRWPNANFYHSYFSEYKKDRNNYKYTQQQYSTVYWKRKSINFNIPSPFRNINVASINYGRVNLNGDIDGEMWKKNTMYSLTLLTSNRYNYRRRRRNFNRRFAYRYTFSYYNLFGDDAFSEVGSRAYGRNLHFRNRIVEFKPQLSYSLFGRPKLGVLKLLGGVSWMWQQPQQKTNSGDWVNLKDINVENKKINRSIFAIPLGIEYSHKITRKISFNLGYHYNFALSDALDGVQGDYSSVTGLSPIEQELMNRSAESTSFDGSQRDLSAYTLINAGSDSYLQGHAPGDSRTSNSRNDQFSTVTIGVSFNLYRNVRMFSASRHWRGDNFRISAPTFGKNKKEETREEGEEIDDITILSDSLKILDEVNELSEVKMMKSASVMSMDAVQISGVSNYKSKPKSKKSEVFEDLPSDSATKVQTGGANMLRTDFNDEAFWSPSLVTDDSGRVSFTVKMPEDITGWKSSIVGFAPKNQYGAKYTTFTSYKPIVGRLYVPRFLIEGDEASVMGKVQNFEKDSLLISSYFKVGESKYPAKSGQIMTSKTYHQTITAKNLDTVNVQYVTSTSNARDGEERKIPVFQLGTEEVNGQFSILSGDTSFVITPKKDMSDVTVYIQGDILEVLKDEALEVEKYAYYCNEQMASKLIAMLTRKRIATHLGEKFKEDRKIKSLIQKLKRNQNNQGGWSWWNKGMTNFFMTLQVYKSLQMAEKQGFTIPSLGSTKNLLRYKSGDLKNPSLSLLEQMAELKIDAPYHKILDSLSYMSSAINEMKKMRIHQLIGDTIEVKGLLANKKETFLGGIYWGEENNSWYNNSIQLSLLAYKILRTEKGYEEELKLIRRFLLEKRARSWRNTHESSSILYTIVPDLLENQKKGEKPVLNINGVEWTSYPQQKSYSNQNPIEIKSTGNGELFFTAYQKKWNRTPEAVESDFIVKTSFVKEGKELTSLTGAEAVSLKVDLQVKKLGNYIMLEIPVPAGCSYQNKNAGGAYEVHREYHKDKVVLFFEDLPVGKYTYQVNLQPRYVGKYSVNPAKVSLMYFPTFFGRTGVKKVEIK